MSKRVLIFSTSAGSGHKAAAVALEEAFRAAPEVSEVVHRDALELTSDTLQRIYEDLFLGLVKNTPHLVGWWYDQSDLPGMTDRLRGWLDQLNAEDLVTYIRDFQPDIIVCTHYMPASIVAELIANDACSATLSIVTTDYDFHSMWLMPCFHRYFVPIEETRAHLTALGIPAEHITVSGIPVHSSFSAPPDRAAILEAFQLSPDLPTLLLSAGTVGGGPMLAIIEQLLALQHDAQSVVVCGKNEELRGAIERLVAPRAARFRVLGYTDRMADLMRIATLFIGKPGGLTSAEAMVVGIPMMIGMPIPGQEERNSDHLLEKGAAIRFNDLTVIAHKIDALLADPERLAQMRDNTRRLARPDAAQVIVATTLGETLASYCLIDKAALRQMRATITGSARAQPAAAAPSDNQVLLFEERTGVPLGSVSARQLQALQVGQDPQQAASTCRITAEQISYLREQGAGEHLLIALQKLIGSDIRWA